MTFKQFEVTVKHFRNDIVVSKHGDYCHNKSQNTLGIMYLKKDGEFGSTWWKFEKKKYARHLWLIVRVGNRRIFEIGNYNLIFK